MNAVQTVPSMSLRTTSADGDMTEGFGIRQNHLAVNNATPDSPRPQKTPSSDNGATLIIPTPPKNNQSSKSRS